MSIVTISRGVCSGGTELAELLSQRLGWKALRHDDVSAAAAETYRVSEKELMRGLDMPATFYERFTHRKTRYLLATQATIADLLSDGDGIYHGLAGQFLFRNVRHVFKVRLVAPAALRIDNAMHRMGLSRDEAARHIRASDEHRLLWGRQMFDADVNDPDLYDLVVNLEQVSLEIAANLIAEIMQEKSKGADRESLREFQDFTLEKRIKAELFFNSPFTPDTAQVSVRHGEVYLRGNRAFETNRDKVIEFVSRISGVAVIHSDHHTTSTAKITLHPDSALSSQDTTARDIMLDIDRYPHCAIDCTIRGAMVALTASSVRLEDDHFVPPRYVLVHDFDDRLVGVVSRRELLKGLIPHLKDDREAAAHIQDLVPFGAQVPNELFIQWTSLFSAAALDASKTTLETVMVPVRGTINADDSLSSVISSMLLHNVDLAAVLDGSKVVGVVLMTDIFDIVAQFVIEHGMPNEKGQSND
ncbi:MAG: cytidylate kinase family protein [Thermoanaerobaculales bacterium]|jgi:cytidylate kinase|nr:cytidylate kinase family protein [Thermoanaerobaculales bacterium]